MEGSVIIDFGTGWACSNEAGMLVDRKIITENGKRLSKHTNTVRMMYYMVVEGKIEKDMLVEVVFKSDETEEKTAYKAKIVGLTEEMAILEVLEEVQDYKEITKKIKRRI